MRLVGLEGYRTSLAALEELLERLFAPLSFALEPPRRLTFTRLALLALLAPTSSSRLHRWLLLLTLIALLPV